MQECRLGGWKNDCTVHKLLWQFRGALERQKEGGDDNTDSDLHSVLPKPSQYPLWWVEGVHQTTPSISRPLSIIDELGLLLSAGWLFRTSSQRAVFLARFWRALAR
jgi:hypothetical protein